MKVCNFITKRLHHGCFPVLLLDPLDWLKTHLRSVTLNYLSLQKFVNILMKLVQITLKSEENTGH